MTARQRRRAIRDLRNTTGVACNALCGERGNRNAGPSAQMCKGSALCTPLVVSKVTFPSSVSFPRAAILRVPSSLQLPLYCPRSDEQHSRRSNSRLRFRTKGALIECSLRRSQVCPLCCVRDRATRLAEELTVQGDLSARNLPSQALPASARPRGLYCAPSPLRGAMADGGPETKGFSVLERNLADENRAIFDELKTVRFPLVKSSLVLRNMAL